MPLLNIIAVIELQSRLRFARRSLRRDLGDVDAWLGFFSFATQRVRSVCEVT